MITDAPVKPASWGWDILSRIFHVGTSNVCSDLADITTENFAEKYMAECSKLNSNDDNHFLNKPGVLIDLPQPDTSVLEAVPIYSAFKNRKTCRAFDAESITLAELSLILFMSFGLIHGEFEELEKLDLKQTGIRKASPSSGGVHAEEAYVVVFGVDGLEPGLYHYRPQDHKLVQLKLGSFEKKVIEMNYKQFFSEGMAFGIYITSRLPKIWWKYKHSRSYRSALLDIGHVSQTFLMSATAMGLQTWLTAAFHDSDVEQFLSVKNEDECVILFVGAGKGKDQSMPDSIIEQLNN